MDLKESIDQIRLCTVKVIFFVRWKNRSPNGKLFERFVLGSGFLVSKEGIIVTANHIFDDCEEMLEECRNTNGTAQYFVGLCSPNIDESYRGAHVQVTGTTFLTEFEIVDRDQLNDIALLKLKKNPFDEEYKTNVELYPGRPLPILKGVPRLNPNRPHEGEKIGLSGFCLDSDVLVTKSGQIASSWYTMQRKNQKTGSAFPENIDVYLIDCQAPGGYSGGPVFLVENASIIGLLSASLLENVWDGAQPKNLYYDAGLGIVIPSCKIIEMLRKNKVTHEVYQN